MQTPSPRAFAEPSKLAGGPCRSFFGSRRDQYRIAGEAIAFAGDLEYVTISEGFDPILRGSAPATDPKPAILLLDPR